MRPVQTYIHIHTDLEGKRGMRPVRTYTHIHTDLEGKRGMRPVAEALPGESASRVPCGERVAVLGSLFLRV